MKSKRVAAYLRVSTDDGRQTVENQRIAIERYAATRDDWKLVKMFEDHASGGTFDRQGLNALRKACDAGAVDIVVVWRLDRLGRSVIELLETLSWFGERGVGFASVMESIDTTSSAGKLLLTFIAAVAEYERALIRERTVAGLKRVKASGRSLGRPRKGIDIETLLRLRREGRSVREIARALNASLGHVQRTLKAFQNPPL